MDLTRACGRRVVAWAMLRDVLPRATENGMIGILVCHLSLLLMLIAMVVCLGACNSH